MNVNFGRASIGTQCMCAKTDTQLQKSLWSTFNRSCYNDRD